MKANQAIQAGISAQAAANIAAIARIAKNRDLLTKKAVAEALAEIGQPKARADDVTAFRAYIHQSREARRKVRPGSGWMPPKFVSLNDRYIKKLLRIARKELLSGAYRWAQHGDVVLRCTRDPANVGVLQVDSHAFDVYGGSFKGWSCRIQDTTITIPFSWVNRVQKRGLTFVDGLFTLDAAPVLAEGCELYAATWLEQGRGTSLTARSGYIARIGDCSYHAESAQKAVAGIKRKAREQKITAALYKPAAKIAELVACNADMRVSLADARATGACEYGIRSWCNSVGLDYDAGSATLGEVFAAYQQSPRAEARATVLRVLKRAKNLELIEA